MKKRHHGLEAWKRAMALVKEIYEITNTLPKQEQFGLTGQMRRAAVPIPSNIAEGAARSSTKEFRQFLYIARGSLMELETQTTLSRVLGYIDSTKYESIQWTIEGVFAPLSGLIKSLGNMSREP